MAETSINNSISDFGFRISEKKTESESILEVNRASEIRNPKSEINNLFPIFLKLEKFRLLIVGGGFVGMEKLSAVLANSPDTTITLLGREVSDEIKKYAQNFEKVTLYEKVFEPTDIDGHDFIIAATNDKKINTQIKRLAEEKHILCNVADTPDECDFYLSSVVQKGNLKIAISTNGKSPTVAKRLREMLTETLPDTELNEILTNMGQIRQKIGGDFAFKVNALNKITSVLVDDSAAKPETKIIKQNTQWKVLAIVSFVAFGILLIGNLVALYFYLKNR